MTKQLRIDFGKWLLGDQFKSFIGCRSQWMDSATRRCFRVQLFQGEFWDRTEGVASELPSSQPKSHRWALEPPSRSALGHGTSIRLIGSSQSRWTNFKCHLASTRMRHLIKRLSRSSASGNGSRSSIKDPKSAKYRTVQVARTRSWGNDHAHLRMFSKREKQHAR